MSEILAQAEAIDVLAILAQNDLKKLVFFFLKDFFNELGKIMSLRCDRFK